ncbi:MAG: GNAT family N-acetyltransferase [Treponema sp.]|nr:GNAT family N-acetyltransferase [Treponema sp.]
MTVPTLETERLILRPLTMDDLDAVYKWASDPRVNKYMIYPLYKSKDDGVEWLNTLYEDDDKKDFGFVLKETGELIGSGGIYYHSERGLWSIGYNLAYDYWNRGFTTEAMEKIIEWGRQELGVKEVAATFAVENVGSRRVMEKLGMTFLEDHDYTKLDGSETFTAKTYHKVL